jgi:hypothetical protein
MMETLSDAEKIRLDGSIRAFYKNIYLLLLMYSSNTGAARYARYQAIADSVLPPGFRELPLCIFGYSMLFYEFLLALKQDGVTAALKRAYRGIQRIINQY